MLSQKPNEAPPTGRGVTPTVTQMPLVTRAPPVAPRLASLSLDDSPKIGSSGQRSVTVYVFLMNCDELIFTSAHFDISIFPCTVVFIIREC